MERCAKDVPDWHPNLACPTPGRPSIDCANYKPAGYFLTTFPIEMVNLIVNETNRYFDQQWQQKEDNAASTSADIGTSSKHANASWVPTTEAEVKVFLALMIIIGLYHYVMRMNVFFFDPSPNLIFRSKN